MIGQVIRRKKNPWINYMAKTIIDEEKRGFVILTYPSGYTFPLIW